MTNKLLKLFKSSAREIAEANHCVKSVHILSYSGPHFPASGLKWYDTPYLSVFSPNEGKYGPE